jgi:hypothetical protein
MAPPLFDEMVTYDDGTPETVEPVCAGCRRLPDVGRGAAYGRAQADRFHGHHLPVLIFASLLYLTKKSVWPARSTDTDRHCS